MALDLSGDDGSTRRGSAIVVGCDHTSGLEVAGLPLWKRAVLTARRAGFDRIVVLTGGSTGAIAAEIARDPRLGGVVVDSSEASPSWLAAASRWVVHPASALVDADHLRRLSETSGSPAATPRAAPFAADREDLARWSARGWTPIDPPPEAPVQTVGPGTLHVRVHGPADVPAAEDALFRSLARNDGNPFARYVDRAMSRAISRRLARTSVTPNAITVFSTALGIAGALVLLRPSYAAGVAGAFLFLAHTVVDGCDGEIARLKFQTSRIGATLDLVGDNLVHAVLFPCLALRFHFRDPSGPYVWLGAAAVAGMVASWAAVWIVIVRREPSSAERRIFEAFANREFAYLLFVLALAGRLEWFLRLMVVGIWAFPLALFAPSLARRVPARSLRRG